MKGARNFSWPLFRRCGPALAVEHFLLGGYGPLVDGTSRSLEDDHQELRATPEIDRRRNREARDAGVLVVVALLGDEVQILERRDAVLGPRARQRNRRYLAGVDRREQ